MNRRELLMGTVGAGLAKALVTDTPTKAADKLPNTKRGNNPIPIGYLIKKKSSEIKESPFGLQFYTMGEDTFELLMDRMGESGVKWARIDASWPLVEIFKGQFNWRRLDKIVDGLTSRGVNIFMLISGSNRLYHDFPAGHYYPPIRVPQAFDGFCEFSRKLVERYSNRVKHYEIWNEPNHNNFWRPKPNAKEYGLLVQRVGKVIHETNRNAKVIAGSMAGPSRNYALEFLAQPGVPEQVDILSYHPYGADPEAASKGNVIPVRNAVRKLYPNLPIWQGECGCPSSGDSIHSRGAAPWGYNVQSKWILRRLLTDRLDGAEVSIYFLNVEFHDHLKSGNPELRMGYNTKGLTQHTTWEAKPAHYTLQNLTATIDSSCKVVEEKAAIEIIDPGYFYGIGPHETRFPCTPWQVAMRKNGVPILAYWLPWRPQEIIKPATVRIAWPNVSWKEPVYLDLLTGETFEAIVRGSELEVPLADYPIIVTERSVLKLAETPQQPSYDEIVGKLRWTSPL